MNTSKKMPLNHFTFTLICKFWKQFDTTSLTGLFPPSRKKPWERAGIWYHAWQWIIFCNGLWASNLNKKKPSVFLVPTERLTIGKKYFRPSWISCCFFQLYSKKSHNLYHDRRNKIHSAILEIGRKFVFGGIKVGVRWNGALLETGKLNRQETFIQEKLREHGWVEKQGLLGHEAESVVQASLWFGLFHSSSTSHPFL